ncbi:MAG: LPS export ABC transporter permease LptG [Gammaproteobacteria bacterium]|nr:LPS export ABC transporter permease LptG [Gammaproteobacteria bacterium]
MSILERYIAGNLIRSWFVVLLVLGTVFGLIALIQELDRSHGGYGVVQVFNFTLMSLPHQLLDLMPVIALLGTILALAGLDKSNELTIICCSGVPLWKLLKAIAIPTAGLMILLWLCLEFVSAPLFQSAQQLKSSTRNDNPEVLPNGGVWSKYRNRYIHIGKMRNGKIPGNIDLFRFDDEGELILAISAHTARVSPDRRWQFMGVRKKALIDGEFQTSHAEQLEIDNLWSQAELPTLSLSSQSMRLSVLYEYIAYLKANEQAHEDYEFTFWQRLTLPVTVAAMILLATPISASIGSRRDSNLGYNMAFGALIGIFFFLGSQITYAVGQLLHVNYLLTTLSPVAAVLLFSAFMLRRMRW